MSMTVRVERRFDGALRQLIIDRPKGNIISLQVITDLRKALASITDRHVKLVTIEGAGDHFSYGAAVDEHRPAVIGHVLASLHDLVREMLRCPAPTAAIVRGRCLGGGFEIALGCDFIFASRTAVLGVPEVSLGVFPPLAAAILPVRIGASRAMSSIISGQPRSALHWQRVGLVERLSAPEALEADVDEFYRAFLAPRSAVALGRTAQAGRLAITTHLERVLPELERLYLDDLMRSRDAVEGITAFLEKREPAWSDA
jgi:cyclohexa-1,5-dienecarbonyl-CoA hydratase